MAENNGPWRSTHARVWDAADHDICVASYAFRQDARAMAARIAAMGNACSGIPTATLEALGEGGLAKAIELLGRAYDKLVYLGESRDEVPVVKQPIPDEGNADSSAVGNPDVRMQASHSRGRIDVPLGRENGGDHRAEGGLPDSPAPAVAAQPPARTADECLDYLQCLATGPDDYPYDEEANIIRAELAALRKQVAEGEKDTKRINWLLKASPFSGDLSGYRAAIDNAMSKAHG